MDNTHYKEFLKKLGNQVRLFRKAKGLTMEDLAYKAEIEYRQLGRIERGEVNTTVISLKKLADALQIDTKDFFKF